MLWLKRLFIILLVLATLFGVSGYFIAKKYDSIVQNAIITNLNKKLSTPVNVGAVELSLFSSFPYASLDFYDVLISESFISMGEPDTLVFAKKLKLNFNVMDIYNGIYTIKKVHIIEGKSKIKFNEKGVGNYNIYKQNADTTSKNFKLELTEIFIEKVNINYSDKNNSLNIEGDVIDLKATGKFSQTNYALTLSGELKNLIYQQPSINPLNFNSVDIDINLGIDTENETYTFNQNELVINKLHSINVAGKVEKSDYDLIVVGNKLQLKNALSLYSTEWANSLDSFEADGIVDLKFTIHSNPKNEAPTYQLNFSLEQGKVLLQKGAEKLNNIYAKGTLKPDWKGNIVKGKVVLDSIYFPFSEGQIRGSGLIENLEAPKFTAKLQGRASIKSGLSFMNYDSLPQFNANVIFKGKVIWPLWRWNFETPDLEKLQFENLNFSAEAFAYEIAPNDLLRIPYAYGNLSGNKLILDSLETNRNFSDAQFKGSIINLWQFIFNSNQKLLVKGSLTSKKFVFEDLLLPSNGNEEAGTFFPSNIAANLQTSILNFVYGNFTSDSATSDLLISPSLIKASNLKLKTMNGWLFANLKLVPLADQNLTFSSTGTIKNIEIVQLFKSFDNFNQTYIRADHLRGKATASYSASGIMNTKFDPDYKSLNAVVDLNIDDGRLINFEGLADINEYFKTQSVLKRLINTDEFGKRIKNIQFSNVNNTFNLTNEAITIPSMKVKSTAMNIELEGTHSFNNDIDYSLNFDLRDLMMKDAKNQTEFGEIEDDGLGGKIIYLKILGNVDDFEMQWDKRKKREASKATMQQEKETIKQILKQEFSGDPTTTPVEEKEFEIIWDEFESQPDTSLPESPADTVKKEDGKLKKLIKKALENPDDKTKKPEIIFDDDF